jgi:hypothetical protein
VAVPHPTTDVVHPDGSHVHNRLPSTKNFKG